MENDPYRMARLYTQEECTRIVYDHSNSWHRNSLLFYHSFEEKEKNLIILYTRMAGGKQVLIRSTVSFSLPGTTSNLQLTTFPAACTPLSVLAARFHPFYVQLDMYKNFHKTSFIIVVLL